MDPNLYPENPDERSDLEPSEEKARQEKRSLVRILLRYFISGTIAVLPLVVTCAIVLWLSNFFMTWLGPTTPFGKLLSGIGIHFDKGGTCAYVLGWLIVLGFLFFLGFFVEVIARKTLIGWIDSRVKKIPVIGMIYGTTRKFTDMFNSNDQSDIKNMSPVYCRFGGVLILALLPSDREYVVRDKSYRVVIIPTAPVPFGGGMFFMPTEDVFPADISIDELLSFYVSMGVSGPDEK